MINTRNVYLWLRIALAVAALFAVGLRYAKAQDATGPASATIQGAMSYCQAAKAVLGFGHGWTGGNTLQECLLDHPLYPLVYGSPPPIVGCTTRYGTRCYNAKIWRYTTGCTAPATIQQDSTCTDMNAACADMKARSENPADGMYISPTDKRTVSGTGANECRGGCTWAANGGAIGIVTTGTGTAAITTAQYRFTGVACPATPQSPPPVAAQVPPKPTAQVCNTPTGTQLTMCIRQDGKHCYAASTGQQICWTPGETGAKSSGNILQKREPGNITAPVPPTPPPGETLTQQGTPTPTTTTTTVNNTTTTTTTTTTNYSTGSGTNAGTTDSGEPATGTGAAAVPGTSAATVSGGSCESNYTCSGGSAVDCAILQETTKTRCATKDLGKSLTGAEETALTGEGSTTAASAIAAGYMTETEHGASGLDTTGYLSGGSSCPVIAPMTIMGQTFTMDTTVVCDWMKLGGALVMLFGALGALAVLRTA